MSITRPGGGSGLTPTQASATYLPIAPTDIGYDIIIGAGQSNMSGRGTPVDTKVDPVHPRIYQYGSSGSYSSVISQAVDPLAMLDVPGSPGLSPLSVFARWYADSAPPYRRILLVPCAYGGTGFSTSSVAGPPAGYSAPNAGGGTWEVGGGGINHYEQTIANATAAVAAAGANSRVVAILWHQGEQDSAISATYAAKLDALIAGFRSRIPGAASVPFILGQMVPDGGNGGNAINTLHVETPYRNTLVAFAYGTMGHVLADGLNVHYDAAGVRLLGRAYFDAMSLAKANVLGVAPVSPGAVTLAQSGSTVTATWVRPVGRATDYLIEYKIDAGAWTTLTHTRSIDNTATLNVTTAGHALAVRVSTVNEQGTSSPTTAAPLTLAAVPAQVTGLAAGTPTGTTVPLTWTAVTGATSYKIQSSPSGAATWTTRNTVTTNSGSATGLTGGTVYDLRVIASNAGGDGTPSSTVSATTSTAGIIDVVGVSAFKAYGTRKLLTAYGGSAVRVRRSSDSTESDIGFTAAGALDTTALLAFAGAGSAYVSVWYDQSGNARDLAQTTTALQPRIVNAGTVDLAGGKPAAVFDGTSTYLTSAVAGVCDLGAATMCLVAASGAQTTQALYSESGTANDARYYVYGQGTGSYSLMVRDSTATSIVDAIKSTTATTQHAVAFADTGSAVTTYIDAATSPYSYSRSGKTITLTRSTLGARRDTAGTASSWWGGSMSEVIAFSASLSSAQAIAAQANQKAYYGTP